MPFPRGLAPCSSVERDDECSCAALLGAIRARPAVVRHNRDVSQPELAQRQSLGSIAVVWIAAAIAGVFIGIFVGADWRAAWLAVALGGCLMLSFVVQLMIGRADGFILRVAASMVGSLLVLGVISLGFALAEVVPR